MTYNEVIKKLELLGIEIDYSVIDIADLNAECLDVSGFESKIKK
jgi:hypothetical protein